MTKDFAYEVYFPEQKEFSIPGGVKSSEIFGVYQKTGGKIGDEFIPNPNRRGD